MSELHKPENETPAETRLIGEVGLIGAVAQWCECLHGRDPLLKSLENLAFGLGADIVALVRYARDGSGSSRVVIWDMTAVNDGARRAERGFARSLMGLYFEAARPGSLWFRSMVESGKAADLEEFHLSRHLRELAIVPLEVVPRFIDTIEFRFRDRLRNHQPLILNSLAPVLARTWHNRAQGLFTEAILRLAPAPAATCVAPILSVENPARLSRAEYRVSLLLSHGMSIKEVQSELRISESTLRSHLGNLCAKTNCANLSELIFRLKSASPNRSSPHRNFRSA
jgi:DNA-binding CsgD family transcriptional regulator